MLRCWLCWWKYSVQDSAMFPVNGVAHFCVLLRNVQTHSELAPLDLSGLTTAMVITIVQYDSGGTMMKS